MTFQLLEQDMANAIGFVFDRSVDPPALLGQGFLVSRSRFVCPAGRVFHYTEAPWALELYFPHPDIHMGIKTVTLHPDFDKPLARTDYLNQQGKPGETLPILPNDMAILVVDSQVSDLMPERVGELNRAMSLPFNNQGVEMSGPVKGSEYLQILNNVMAQNKQGLLTLFDAHNIPIARLLIAPNSIPLVYYHNHQMPPAYAFFELAIKQPAAGFAFQPAGEFPWPDMTPINAPADRLIWEAMRRANEMEQFFTQLGGRDARYQRVVQEYDPTSSSDEIKWMVPALWEALDGYLTIENLSEKSGADAYTCLVAIRELVNRGVISQINRHTPFHGNGTVGPPLISHTDFEVHNWDALQAFYLDPLSGKPTWVQGNYFGSASAVQPKNMLHTIPVPTDVHGALICKDYKLIGLHNGPQALRGGVTAPPMKCSQFMWMGALLDVSNKKLKGAGIDGGEESAITNLKTKLEVEPTTAAAPEDRIVCPVCFSPNHDYGACSNCGHVIEKPPEEPEAKTVKDKAGKAVRKIQKKTGLTNQQALIAAGILVPLALFTFSQVFKAPAPPATLVDETKLPGHYAKHENSDAARKLAVEMAGFKVQPISDYWYEDTTELTKPNPSFGVFSERTNQKLIFTIFSDLSVYNNLSAFEKKPPGIEDFTYADGSKSEMGKQILGEDTLNWMIIGGQNGKGAPVRALLCSFPALKENHSILVTGQPYNKESGTSYDPTIAISAIDQLAEERTQKANQSKMNGPKEDTEEEVEDEVKDIATDAEVKKFLEATKENIQKNLELPEWAAEEMKKDKSERRKWKVRLKVGINENGEIKSLEKLSTDEDEDIEKISAALQAAVSHSAPFKFVPKVKEPQLKFNVRLSGDKIKVEKANAATTL